MDWKMRHGLHFQSCSHWPADDNLGPHEVSYGMILLRLPRRSLRRELAESSKPRVGKIPIALASVVACVGPG
jgi:hypothetical protein